LQNLSTNGQNQSLNNITMLELDTWSVAEHGALILQL